MDYQQMLHLAIESFLRRASEIEAPFMVKGSIITRQYLTDPSIRYAADLDWVYLETIDDPSRAGKIFSNWAIKVTELLLFDGVGFRSFRENNFWRMIDYAMADDFPTVNTDLLCFVDGTRFEDMCMDISFNLDLDYPPVPLLYQPLQGEPFELPYTCPLSLQVSWKLHQTIVRPRLKDLIDLIYLLQHEDFDATTFAQSVQALKAECAADQASSVSQSHQSSERHLSKHGAILSLLPYATDRAYQYFQRLEQPSLQNRLNPAIDPPLQELSREKISSLAYVFDLDKLPFKQMSTLILAFKEALLSAGFTPDFIREQAYD